MHIFIGMHDVTVGENMEYIKRRLLYKLISSLAQMVKVVDLGYMI